MKMKMTTLEMEIAIANHFNYVRYLIVPNVSFGLRLNNRTLHECDLLILTGSSHVWEIEIKISMSDLKADKKKYHKHYNPDIRRLYFAIPDFLLDDLDYTDIPDRAGIIIVDNNYKCRIIRKPVNQKGYKLSEKEKFKLAHLGAMRIWKLKSRVKDYKNGR